MKFASFHWDDPLNLEDQLTPFEKEVKDSARAFAQSRLLPRVVGDFRSETFDPSILREMGEQGFLGADLHGYGCKGWNFVCYGLIARELEKIDSGYRTLFSVQSSLAMHAIYLHGSEEQKQQYLPAMAQGRLIGCFGLTEPAHGSDPAGMEAIAEKVAGGYRLTGSKKWSGLAALADVLVVWAKEESGRVLGFIVEKGSKGLETSTIMGKLSLRCAPTGAFEMRSLFVPEERRLPHAQSFAAPFACLNMARYAIAWGAFGAAESCWRIARDYALDRVQFGRPLAATQLVQKKLADMQTEIALGLEACLRVGRLLDEQKAAYEMISLIKRNAALKALQVARDARDILGANGILDEFHVMRHMVNLESVATYEGTNDIHALILGRAQTSIGAF